MPLESGTRLGPYEIVAPLGSGGMGEVYRARDARLDRTVAIKVLPAELAENSDALARFEREAKAVAALSHPNILAIHDFGRDNGRAYAVTELLEGETLRARLSRGALPPRKAIEYGAQIARGLAAAHEAGIVHRDLKPENVFVTRDGRVKVLDFGLAKQLRIAAPTGTSSPTASLQTEAGVLLGTVGYMSPEQVRGEPADPRSDVFSFGAVLYEMSTGSRAFARATAVETLTAILKEDPPAPALGEPLPASLERIVRRCLEKEPEERFQSARDLAFALEAIGVDGSSRETSPFAAPPSVDPRRSKRGRAAAAGAILFLAGAALASFAVLRWRHSKQPAFTPLTFRRGLVSSARFTPDGQTVVYGAMWEADPIRAFSVRLGSPESSALALPPADVLSVSPSGELALSLGRKFTEWFETSGRLARGPLSGAAPRELLDDVMDASWAPDGDRLLIVRAVDGKCRLELPAGNVLFQTAGWISHARVSPRGDQVAFIEHLLSGADNGSICVVSASGKGAKTTLTGEQASAQGLAWRPDGKEIWFTASENGWHSTLRAVTPDGKRRRDILRIPGRLILHDIDRQGRVLAASENVRVGTLLGSTDSAEERDVSWLDSSFGFSLTPDGTRVLLNEQGEGTGAHYGIYLRGIDGSPAVRLGNGFEGALSPDGRFVASVTQEEPQRIVLLPTGPGEPKTLPAAGLSHQAVAWFPDGRRVAFAAFEANHGLRLYAQDIAGGPPRPFTAEGVGALAALAISPDGRWAATLGPGHRAFLFPTQGGDPVALPGLLPGDTPVRFSADGRALYCSRSGTNSAEIVKLDLASGSASSWKTLKAADPAGVFTFGLSDITPDGRRYIAIYARILSDLFLVDGLQ